MHSFVNLITIYDSRILLIRFRGFLLKQFRGFSLVEYLDGPEDVRIIGATEARAGDELSFECVTSDSNPPVDVWWVVDGRAVQVQILSGHTVVWHIRQVVSASRGDIPHKSRLTRT